MAGVCWSCLIEIELAKDLTNLYRAQGLSASNIQVRVYNNARELKIIHNGDDAGASPNPDNCQLARHRCEACLDFETRGDSSGANPDVVGTNGLEYRSG